MKVASGWLRLGVTMNGGRGGGRRGGGGQLSRREAETNFSYLWVSMKSYKAYSMGEGVVGGRGSGVQSEEEVWGGSEVSRYKQ